MPNQDNAFAMDASNLARATYTLLVQSLAKARPKLQEAIYLVSIPHYFNIEMLKMLRASEDDLDGRLIARLAQFSFVKQLADAGSGPRYQVQPDERRFLQLRWIAENPKTYFIAHQRALEFWEMYPDADPLIHVQNRFYHLLVVDGRAGLELANGLNESFTQTGFLAGMERLLATATEVRDYVAALRVPWLVELDRWIRGEQGD